MKPKVLLTRSELDNDRLAARLAEQGIDTLSVPLLAIEPIAEGVRERSLMLDLDRYHAVMVVSPVAARLGLERLDHCWPQAPVGIHWFAVGGTTARILQDYGLPVQLPEDGQDSEAMLRLPVWRDLLAMPALKVLIWRGAGGREHLANQVRAVGGQVDYLELYRRLPPAGLDQALADAADAGVRSIVIASGQALQHWHKASGDCWEHWRRWRLWVPSDRVAAQARELGCDDVRVCKGADDEAVLTALMADPPTR
jgi:uroporphyrinogen-III synthase